MKGMRELKNLAGIWTLRALLHPNGLMGFMKGGGWHSENILQTISLEILTDKTVSKASLKKVFALQLKDFEGKPKSRSGPFFQNLDFLGNMVGLTEKEKEILLFSLLIQDDSGLADGLKCWGDVNYSELVTALSRILKLSDRDIRMALDKKGLLRSSGLIDLELRKFQQITERLQPLPNLCNALHIPVLNEVDGLLSSYFCKAPAAKLLLADFSHLTRDTAILVPFLKAAILNNVPGVNILLYGPPGTGKTELARTLARELGLKLYEVSHEDEEGEWADLQQRFRSYLLCQRILKRNPDCMVIFDEAEDVFPVAIHSFFGIMHQSGRYKGWTNDLLESNPKVTIWISNSVSQIDPAFLRRFDLIIEVPECCLEEAV